MADTNLHGNPPMIAGGEILPCQFVKQSTSANQTLLACGNNERAFGVSAEGEKRAPGLITALGGTESTTPHAQTGDPVNYFGLGQYCLVQCGTGYSAGALLTSDASGYAKTASSTNPVNARALTAATANQRRLVRVSDGWAAP